MDRAVGRRDDAETLVFINYRSSDAPDAAAFLHAEFSDRFGAESVFLDYESIPLGHDFVPVLLRRVRRCAVLVVVVGNRWLDGEVGQRPIDDPDDWVRREILEALAHDIPVVPVLVGGVQEIPDSLPAELAGLTRRQSLEIRKRRQRTDIRTLGDYLVRQIPRLRDRPVFASRRKRRTFIRGTSVVILAAVALGVPTTYAIPAESDCAQPLPAEGPILDKYREERAGENSSLRCPLGPVTATAVGRGQFVKFETIVKRYPAWIYWSQDTGAHIVFGEIGEKWMAVNSEAGQLGFPTSDEMWNPDRVGRRQEFQGGLLYWHPDHRAHPVSGEFFVTWGRTRHEAGALGYPDGDMRTSVDGVGRYQHFDRGTIISHATRSKGAHAVMIKIEEKWRLHGAETGEYGYPIADEVQDGRLFRQMFEGGEIIWDDAIQGYR
jgi:hypothetical protein